MIYNRIILWRMAYEKSVYFGQIMWVVDFDRGNLLWEFPAARRGTDGIR
jgi:hypothetical protein